MTAGVASEQAEQRRTGADPAVSVLNVSLSFGATHVLQDVSLTVAAGEIVAVMGPSGSGKSTLLHCLAGLLTPDSGTVTLDGRDLTGLSDRLRSRVRLERIGFVSQFGDLVPELTIRENVELPVRLLRRPRRIVNRDGRALLDALEVGQVAGRRPGEVSGGQAQRAAVCRALVHRPALVLADEPTGALDTVTGDLVIEKLVQQSRRLGAAVVLVTHEARIAAHADREIVLRDGRIVADPGAAPC